MNSKNPDPDAPSAGTANRIRPLKPRRSSVPLSYELYTSTNDPIVLAFHASAMFHNPEHDPPLTLDGLRQRWQVGRPKATLARRELLDLAYWAEVRSCDARGRFATETRTWELPITEDDLRDLATEYLPGSKISCGGQIFRITAAGELELAVQAELQISDSRPEQRKQAKRAAPAERQVSGGRPTAVTGQQKTDVRPEQGAFLSDPQVSDVRREQAQQDDQPGRTERQKPGSHASSVLRTDEKHACMDELSEFWKTITKKVGRVDEPGQRSVETQLVTALSGAWTPQSLANWILSAVASAKKRQPLANPAGFVIMKLRDIPTTADTSKQVTNGDHPPICGECEAREGDGIHCRMIETKDGGSAKCPRCHPHVVSRAA